MQIGVQGTWGVIPVHLNEMSADVARGLMPGLAYQLGILIASPTNSLEYALREYLHSYQWALATFEIVTIVSLTVLLLAGTEAHSKPFHRQQVSS
jgi:MFS transporter, SHS family, lactate transporter